MTRIYTYVINPMDWQWDAFPDVPTAISRIIQGDPYIPNSQNETWVTVMFFCRALAAAFDAAVDAGWERDFKGSGGVRCFALPAQDEPKWGFVWKQENNGFTFVMSPVGLPYLIPDAIDHGVFDDSGKEE